MTKNYCKLYIWTKHNQFRDHDRVGSLGKIAFDPTGKTQNLVDEKGQELRGVKQDTDTRSWMFGAGHAGLNCHLNGQTFYVTWIPNSGGRMPELFKTYSVHNSVIENLDLQSDANQYGGIAKARKVKLPAMQLNTTKTRIFCEGLIDPFGVYLKAMGDAWNNIRNASKGNEHLEYKMVSKEANCCAKVAQVLMAGRLDFFIKQQNIWFYQNVGALSRWAIQAQVIINKQNMIWNQLQSKTVNAKGILYNIREKVLEGRGELKAIPSYNEWYELSNRGIYWGMRKEQVLNIDTFIKLYEKSEDDHDKLRILIEIMALCYDYIEKKLNNDRIKAIVELLIIVLTEIERTFERIKINSNNTSGNSHNTEKSGFKFTSFASLSKMTDDENAEIERNSMFQKYRNSELASANFRQDYSDDDFFD